MHGRKREDEAVLTGEELRARQEKINKYNAAKAQLLTMRAARQLDAASYALTAKLIEINPDFYTLFNYRKEIVLDMIEKDPSSKSSLSSVEMDLSGRALLRNAKCYGAWQHRLWVLDLGATDASEELKVCDKMLQLDARNFHCWNYRRAVAARAHTPPEDELKFTTSVNAKINENFSNYSAWHYRTVLIPRIYNSAWLCGGEEPAARRLEYEQFLDSEFELVRQAFYTEPEDQSVWLYHRWLLGRVVATGAINQLPVLGISLGTHLFEDTLRLDDAPAAAAPPSTSAPAPDAPTSLARHLHVFTREHQSLVELLEIEPECKWALLTLAVISAGILACLQAQKQTAATAAPIDAVDGEMARHAGSIKSTFDTLIELDPMRINYYKDVRAKFTAI